MKILKNILGICIIISLGYSQVCCSLVGSVGSSSTLSYWEIQWPSPLDFNRKANWIIGTKLGKPYNGDINIKYGINAAVYSEFSDYIFSNTVVYFNSSYNVSNISEHISFSQTETNINQLNFDIGLRQYLSHKAGYIFGSLHLPILTEFSNEDFLFRTNAVSSVSVAWVKPILISTPVINQRLSLQLSATKNLKEDPQVYIDDNYNFNISTPFEILSQFSLSPNLNTNYYKLLAPLSPYDSARQQRWLGVTSVGFDITPINTKINWLHFNGNIPFFSWASEIGFPDGTQPTPSFSITLVKKIFN
jgi:hypothetical protein